MDSADSKALLSCIQAQEERISHQEQELSAVCGGVRDLTQMQEGSNEPAE